MTPTEHRLYETNIRRCALPRRYGSGAKAVLALHGFMGYPGELQYCSEQLAEAGYSVSIPRMPGHGSCGEDFFLSDGRQWLRAAIDHWIELNDEFEEVFVMGHSMGGVMAALLASMFPVKKMVLMAPALKLKKPLGITELMAPFVKKTLTKPLWKPDDSYFFLDSRDTGDDLYLGQEYWTWAYIPRMADLSRLRKKAVSSLKSITADTLCIMGAKDATVSLDSALAVEKSIAGISKTVVLENSRHLVPYDVDYKKNAREIVTWFDS